MKHISVLDAISPIDGRYRSKVEELENYFSESALIKYRIKVEIEYFLGLCELPLPQLMEFSLSEFEELQNIYLNFSGQDAQKVKDIEAVTNHDVKAVEYFIKARFDEMGMGEFKEFVHFGLTSQDINNTAVPLSMKDAYQNCIWPLLDEIQNVLYSLVEKWKSIPMLARTHGQPASPTILGKEIMVFADRLEQQINLLKTIPFSGKFGGATGNFNAHHLAYPEIDWMDFGNKFLKRTLGIERQQITTQIEHYDNMAAFFDGLKRINTIFLDMSRDMWAYISMDYFKQIIKKGEVGSSAMPHKVNPIDFENSEGNLGIANAMFEHLSAKLPISRLQRDLTDSTVTRNIGVPFAHSMIAYKSLLKGLNKLLLNKEKINNDLENNWAVVAEAIQTILRREGYPNPYETLKDMTRTGQKITIDSIHHFIDKLKVPDPVKDELRKITPHNYTGINPLILE
ncbi:MAG: adenylosuccinate lyase [Bacteroidetes bacterium 4484_276]|nr:MAG: adenylosuccinate lyase [Bacteroidetes bacterium 4484_276]OYT12297.1 MAG: adenylosuccinate lyase [Bacteroidetes bacterium 4572_114]